MQQDIRKYFKTLRDQGKIRSTYAGVQLARSGIMDMETLCLLLEQEPEKLRNIRNIGPKSMGIIRAACHSYQIERAEHGEEYECIQL